ncbi:type-1 restriction enzyme EcoKI specificity protein [Roseovarius mucosus]|uniref:Type-1 restriction enzyme EcoKI specificity protein n=1 Tax=Roseovarius mucosus TaxID=215743 RepID=A0A1V0RUP4_9RHOB|nr:restriction endonuclease subunit S [Roseovarius mucosus]ARE85375.1 type-1 restriction enzyme EcoKI specificity protein [Roseovarius mucosus]
MRGEDFTADRLLALYDRVADSEDAIPRLRRFVLDLAVRGKLVEHDPSDEPAAELLKRIAKEKARLVKAGEIKEAKPISFIGEPVTPAPMGWMVVPLGEVINRHLGGGTPSKNDHSYWGGDIRWASVKDVGKAKYVDDTIDRITEKGLENSASNLVPAGNLIVVTRMGLGQLSINRVPVAINQDLRALFLSPFVDIDFVYNFFLTYGMEGTGLTVKGIKIEELLGIAFPLPPLAEQRRIVAKVDELMALCDRLEAARAGREGVRDRLTAATLARLTAAETDAETFPTHVRFALQSLPTLTTRPDQIKTLRQTILNLAVRGKLVAQDPTDEPAAELLKRIEKERAARLAGGRAQLMNELEAVAEHEQDFYLPKEWRWTRLGTVIKLWNGFAFKSADFKTTGIPVIRIGDLSDGEVKLSSSVHVSSDVAASVSDEVWIPEDALLLAMSGATTGKTAFNRTGKKLLLNQRVGRIDCFSMNVNFIRFFFETIIARNLSISLGTAIPNLSTKQIYETAIPLPPLAEQHRIVARVDALMALCDQLEASLTAATTTRSRLLESLLHEALNGAVA